MRYKRGNGNHDRLTVSLSALEAVDFDPACGGGGAGSDIVEANGSARGKQADHYCKPLRTRFLGHASVVLDPGEEMDGGLSRWTRGYL